MMSDETDPSSQCFITTEIPTMTEGLQDLASEAEPWRWEVVTGIQTVVACMKTVKF